MLTTDAAARAGHHRAGRFGAGVPWDPVAVGVLRCQACDAGFSRVVALRVLHDRSGVHVTMVQMPAVNTPQFSWVLSRLPRQAQPVPPICQPEVAARAVAFAARSSRTPGVLGGRIDGGDVAGQCCGSRSFWIAISPKTGFDAQQTGKPHDLASLRICGSRPTGLTAAIYGAHGVFDAVAKPRSAQQWIAHHYPRLAAVGAFAAAGAGAMWWGRQR